MKIAQTLLQIPETASEVLVEKNINKELFDFIVVLFIRSRKDMA